MLCPEYKGDFLKGIFLQLLPGTEFSLKVNFFHLILEIIEKYKKRIDGFEKDIEDIIKQEKEEKQVTSGLLFSSTVKSGRFIYTVTNCK